MTRRLVFRAAGAALALVLVAGAWIFLMPAPLGGTSYVVTGGSSMQPRFHTGDLALVRAGTDYRVGEIVAYHSRSLHTIVLHRIVAQEGDRYVLKGDNNNFIDPEQPTRSQLVGKLWLRLPALGGKLVWLRAPRTIGVLAALAVLLLLGGSASARQRRNRRRSPDTHTRPTRQPNLPASAIPAGVAVASVGLIASLALAGVAFTRPSQGPVTTAAAYTQSGKLSYSAVAPAGAVYPSGRARSGDPIFTRLVHKLPVRFEYQLVSRSPHAFSGSATIGAEIASSNGWKRTLKLQRTFSFTGDRGIATRTLNLRKLERLVRRVESATAVTGGVTYTLTLTPTVRFNGRVAGAPLSQTFMPRIAFTLDPLQLRPQLPSGAPQASTTGQAATPPNPLNPSTSGTVKIPHTAARTLSFHRIHVTVTHARAIATIGAALALSLLLVFAVLALRGRAQDEPARIQARYRDLLIPIARSHRRTHDDVVELTDFETLARLAERYDRMILHEQSALGHSYRITEDGILYTYLIASAAQLPRGFATATLASKSPR